MSSNSKLIFDSYCILTSASPLYQQCWMCDETIFMILNSHYPHLKKAFNFTRTGLNRASLPRLVRVRYKIPMPFIAQFRTDCPYSGDRRKVFYYFRQDTNNNEPPDDPVSVSDVVDKLALSNQLQRNCIRLGSTCPMCVWSWGGKGEEGGEEMEKGEGA